MDMFCIDGNIVAAENQAAAESLYDSHMLGHHYVKPLPNLRVHQLQARINEGCKCGAQAEGPWWFGPGSSHGVLCGWCGYAKQWG